VESWYIDIGLKELSEIVNQFLPDLSHKPADESVIAVVKLFVE
jgi:hypothetical protein